MPYFCNFAPTKNQGIEYRCNKVKGIEMETNLECSLFFNNWDIVFRNVKARDSF